MASRLVLLFLTSSTSRMSRAVLMHRQGSAWAEEDVGRIMLLAASRLHWATIEPGKADIELLHVVEVVVAGVLVVGVIAEVVEAGELIGPAVGRKRLVESVRSCCTRISESSGESGVGEMVEESIETSSWLFCETVIGNRGRLATSVLPVFCFQCFGWRLHVHA